MKIKITIDSNSPTLELKREYEIETDEDTGNFLTVDLIERIANDKAKYTTFNHGEGVTPVAA